MKDLILPVVLDSPAAEAGRKLYADLKAHELRSRATQTLGLPPRELVEQLLDREQAGDPDAWWRLTRVMTLEPPRNLYKDAFRTNLTAYPGWQEADPATRGRIMEASHRYVLGHQPSPDRWFFRAGRGYFPDEAGLKALRLLCDQAPDQFGALGLDVWSRWAPVIVGYPISGDRDDEEARSRLVGHAYRNAPTELLDWLARWLEEQGRRENPYLSPRLWADLPGPALIGILMDRVRDPSTNPWVLEILLDDLLTRDVPGAREFTGSLLGPPCLADADLRPRTLAAARSLVTHAPDAGWSMIWPILQENHDFGHALVESIAASTDRASPAPFLDRLSEDHVADLYVWIVRQFPKQEGEEHDDLESTGDRESMAFLRHGILRHLERRGTVASLAALDAIARDFPHLDWIARVRLEAEKVVMARTWTPHRLEDLRALTQDKDSRLVDGGDQLLDVVLESLGRYQCKLRGETPASFMLWDRQADGKHRPKQEEKLSDALKLHLVEDLAERGIVANREVVIRGGSGGKPGERTDIHIDAITGGHRRGAYDCVTIVIEVKGCWNSDVATAMKEQLRDRYLAEGGCRHGLYVVGWFPIEQWDSTDYRRADARRLLPSTLDEARSRFAAQAEDLSHSGLEIRAVVLDCSLS